jgi:hypothetical protein
MDRTIEFILGNAELHAMHNDMSYLEFTQKCEVNHINRCMIRNFIARKMKEEEEAAVAAAAQVPAEAAQAAQAPAVLVEDGEKEGTNLTKAQDCSKMKQKKKKSKDKNKNKNNDKSKRRVPTAKNIANIVNSGISSIVISKKKK